MGQEHLLARQLQPRGLWRKTIDILKGLNTRAVRLHKQPPPQFVLDMADETGLCLIAESAIDGPTGGATPFKVAEYVVNSVNVWVPTWVKGNRNHPSILIWSAMNEMHALDKENAQKISKVVRDLDPTRPIIYEGHSNPETYKGGDPNTDINFRHYPRPFGNMGETWTGSGEPWDAKATGASTPESGSSIRPSRRLPVRPCINPGGKANAAQERNAW